MTHPTLKDIFAEARNLVELASKKKLTLATAESCTGGLIGAAITAIPGSSAAFKGGIIAYDNAAKNKFLKVPPGMIHKYGAVSRHVALAMAKGAIEALNVDIAVSVTGIAGPGGGSKGKPVGTVWIGIAWLEEDNIEATAKLHRFGDIGRNKVRDITCYEALKVLVETLK
jgi:PncC family amidohydrolase